MSIDYINDDPDFDEAAKDRVPIQFKDSPNYNKIVEVFAERYKGLHDTAVTIPSAFLLESAEGAQLDELGTLLKVIRDPSDTDEMYRQRIKLFTSSLRKSATRDEIVDILTTLTMASDVNIFKGTNRYVEVSMLSDYLARDRSGYQVAKLFPVTANLVVLNRGRGKAFGFEGSKNSTGGFGDAGDTGITKGAGFAGIIYQTNAYEQEG